MSSDHAFRYAKASHAAAHTGDYVFHQLIPYIGNKRKLLGLIQTALAFTDARPGDSFLDLFAGSGVVARMAKRLGFAVSANDWEPYAEAINRCYIVASAAPPYAALGGYDAALATLNGLEPQVGWVTRHLCPADDQRPDMAHERMFYTRANGMRIDAIREQIAAWFAAGAVDELEQACLLAPLLYQASYTSNTSGVFKGFHHGWGGRTGTALYRILSSCILRPAVFHDNGLPGLVYRLEAEALARRLAAAGERVKIAYLDPPYNQHPYGSNYHVLNSITLWDKPQLSERIEGRNKAAIRADWRSERRSAYNYRGEATRAYAALLGALQADHILTSYSSDGMIGLEDLVGACVARGHTQVALQAYKRYRVSTQRFSPKPLNVELVLVVNTARPHSGPDPSSIAGAIRQAEAAALEAR
jgi:adenine-specific DNA-methyltransferase